MHVELRELTIFGLNFTFDELRHLVLATILVYLVEMSFVLLYFKFPRFETAIILSLAFIPLYLVHELAHKSLAQYFGHRSRFQIVQLGAALTAISIFLPTKLLAPGGIFIPERINREIGAKISVAGPLVNMIIAGLLFFMAGMFHGFRYYSLLLGILANFSLNLAFFSLFPTFDGNAIHEWNKDCYYALLGACLFGYLFNPLGLLTSAWVGTMEWWL